MVSKKTQRLIDQNNRDLEQINEQRRTWLYASSVVIISVLVLIFGWDWLDTFHSKTLWWVVVSLILIVSVNWWYWTMRVMLRLINHQKIEFSIISELLTDIREIRKEVRQLGAQELDNKK
jgi:ABC-type proline/glycine betaine transport system permease subunit